MKFKVQKEALVRTIGKTQNIVERRNAMPALTSILLEVEHDSLKVFSTDLEVSLTDEIEADVDQPGKLAIDAKNLFNVIRELGPDQIFFERKPNNWIEIRQKKSVFNLMGSPAEEYPIFPSFSVQEFLHMKSDVLRDMIEKTIYSVSSDETRHLLNGVYFEQYQKGDGVRYRMVATDGHRLSLIDRPTEMDEKKKQVSLGVIVPRKGLLEIKKVLESSDKEDVDIAIEGNQLIFKQRSTVMMVRLIEGKYPNYQQLIPQNLKCQMQVQKDLFMTSLKRVSLLSNQKSRGVTLTIHSRNLQITSNNPEMGDAKEELEIDYDGDEIKISFNSRYLMDVLSAIEDDKIDFEFNDQLSPSVIRPVANRDYTCIVMPMRI